jgi:uncharacterized protein (DUF924 family)
MTSEGWTREVLDFWFAQKPETWWSADEEFDSEVRERFLEHWEEQQQRLVESFLGSPDEALAAVILFDQFPRNMFRGDARTYATDHMALAIAKAAVGQGYDETLGKDERTFLYMPYQHSEVLADQQRSLALFSALDDPELLRFAKLHHDVIERFGRFPHRNAILGRAPRPDEVAAGNVVPW